MSLGGGAVSSSPTKRPHLEQQHSAGKARAQRVVRHVVQDFGVVGQHNVGHQGVVVVRRGALICKETIHLGAGMR